LDDLEDHWQPVRSAILATAELLGVFYSTALMWQTDRRKDERATCICDH